MATIYTKEEIQYYFDNKKTKTIKQIAKELNRSAIGLKGKVYRVRVQNKTVKHRAECNYTKMLNFAKQLNPKYNYMTEVFNDYTIKEFIKLYTKHNENI